MITVYSVVFETWLNRPTLSDDTRLLLSSTFTYEYYPVVICKMLRTGRIGRLEYDVEQVTTSERLTTQEAKEMTPERLIELCRNLEAKGIAHAAGWEI